MTLGRKVDKIIFLMSLTEGNENLGRASTGASWPAIKLLFVFPTGQGGGRSSFTRKESAVECSFTGKEPVVEYEVERMKSEKMKK